MREVTLFRGNSTNEGSFGYLASEGVFWRSLELPDRDNRPNVSCIPKGSYDVVRRYSPHFKRELYWVKGVKGRSYILFHRANFAGDVEKGYQTHLQGCVTLGKKTGAFKNKFGKKQKAILLSGKAVQEFTEFMNAEPFKLHIKDLYV